MQIQVDFWQLVGLGLTVLGSFAGIVKLLMGQYLRNVDQRFVALTEGVEEKFANVAKLIEALSQQGEKYGADVQRLERELAGLRLEMMRDFTRREDFNQAIASIRIAVDNMSLRIEKALSAGARING